MYQLRNLLHRTNVRTDPKKDFNACDDFFATVVTSHIVAAALKLLNMSSADDKPTFSPVPNLVEVWVETKECRKEALDKVSEAVVDNFITFKFHESPTLRRHDGVFEYATQMISIGCFYREFSDAIREGDGDRVLRCWKYLLLMFHSSGRTNYSIECLNMLRQHFFLLTPRKSEELIWSRFVNSVGRRGKNIPADLHMEHLNRLCKGAITGLGANKSKRSITRVAEALGTITPVLANYDSQNNVADVSGLHNAPPQEKDVRKVANQLLLSDVFSIKPRRKHKSFSKVRDVLHHEKRSDLSEWMEDRV